MKKKIAQKSSKILDVVYLHTETKQRLERLHDEIKELNPTLKFHPFVENIMMEYLASKDFQKKYVYPIEFKAIVDQHVVLRDNVAGKPVLVSFNESTKSLYCENCEMDSCLHVGFVYANQITSGYLAKKEFFKDRQKI